MHLASPILEILPITTYPVNQVSSPVADQVSDLRAKSSGKSVHELACPSREDADRVRMVWPTGGDRHDELWPAVLPCWPPAQKANLILKKLQRLIPPPNRMTVFARDGIDKQCCLEIE